MTLRPHIAALRSHLRRFAGNRDGVSAVEFALVLPVMLTLYLGGVEVGDGMAIQFKTTLAARTVADLASQYNNTTDPITTSTMSNILAASSTVLSPYTATGTAVTVSEVTTDSKGNATITWSCSLGGTAHSVGSKVTLPSGVQTPSISVIWGEVNFPYQPKLGYVLSGTINIYQDIYFYPRMTTAVTGPSSCPSS
jgi:Flp pilus assembly protein TadG